ncbi:hypothetical protein F7D01_03315 [Erythrobacter sp. 3-20A1M]|uniref:hypothetical protein n=1 Tax=Erythrobacter sp. 3-20A1M TaxID=2653850 RepID=UPI001BFC7818|nr:hypothetical protein [Erythrobacter sp. 3-20A1M]QWC56245.1 hypothetical protein F7D01_03315 [Erythrobacter sp. 3-20A1M]
MLGLAFSLAMSAAATWAACPEDIPAGDFLFDVCEAPSDLSAAYSATMRASLKPAPAAQQVTIFRDDGKWRMRVVGYRWTLGAETVSRQNEFEISDRDAEVIIDRMSSDAIEELAQRPYFGREGVICTDGSSYELAIASRDRRLAAKQHSCAGKTELNKTAAVFRRIALKYDPAFDGMLDGLRG